MINSQKLRIIFIAYSENSLGRRILSNMVKEGIMPIKAFMGSPKEIRRWRKKSIKRYLKNNSIFDTIWRMLYRLTLRRDVKTLSLQGDAALNQSIQEQCKKHNIPIYYFNNFNDISTIEKLTQLQPDLIVLGGSPIIKKEVISVPKIAVLNSHPGVLPEAKGMDVVTHSILHNIPLGSTVFKIDSGIDSGPILLTEYLKDYTEGLRLDEIEAKIEALCSIAMIKGIKMIEAGQFEFHPQSGNGTLFKSLSYSEYILVRSKLSSASI